MKVLCGFTAMRRFYFVACSWAKSDCVFSVNLKITGLKDQVTYYLGNRVSNLKSVALGGSNLSYSERGNLL